MYEFFQSAFPWILLGLFVAVSCAFLSIKRNNLMMPTGRNNILQDENF